MTRKTLLAVLAAATLVAGCGVQPTGVVPAGPGPSIRATTGPAVAGGLTLYFVSEGRVIPVTRPSEGFISAEGAITLLMKGPTEREAAQGLTTFIPPEVGRVEVYSGQPGTMVLPFTARKLSSQALNQLVCTAMAASPSTGQGPVAPGMNLTSPEGDLHYQGCKSG
ncbi:hypothetical protein BS329_31975 [Amycolatopsis coloradensis]|uniref:GerMN domain-containing protein n=1 Tax=Amycolatopsis coloradensis TaxID=76021 RepID=A0A1R0KIM9_9PSEU|nr:GerMN domain-containing protein [Amycolatopsis coloradensis]OLZ45665.1 hypothetical protein BS329_31975 [Amycolatopsis coloradensis]